MTSALTWFEIPSADFDRAVDFYSTVIGKPLHKQDFNGVPNGIFPYEQGKGIGGSVVFSEEYTPSAESFIIYLDAESEANLDAMLTRIESAGGKVLMPKTHIGVPGHIALFMDTEGNRVGLNAQPQS
ncbi:MAG: VOC family protein [Aggregatilineales bacterium]